MSGVRRVTRRRLARWALRIFLWSLVAALVLFATAARRVFCETTAVVETSPHRWVLFEALNPEVQQLFDGSFRQNLMLARAASRPASGHVVNLARGKHLELFLTRRARREYGANFSLVASLEKPYQVTLEQLADNNTWGWLLVRDELERMRVEGVLSEGRYLEVREHLDRIVERRGLR